MRLSYSLPGEVSQRWDLPLTLPLAIRAKVQKYREYFFHLLTSVRHSSYSVHCFTSFLPLSPLQTPRAASFTFPFFIQFIQPSVASHPRFLFLFLFHFHLSLHICVHHFTCPTGRLTELVLTTSSTNRCRKKSKCDSVCTASCTLP